MSVSTPAFLIKSTLAPSKKQIPSEHLSEKDTYAHYLSYANLYSLQYLWELNYFSNRAGRGFLSAMVVARSSILTTSSTDKRYFFGFKPHHRKSFCNLRVSFLVGQTNSYLKSSKNKERQHFLSLF